MADVDIEGMDDKAFDALKADMMSGKDVAAPEPAAPADVEAGGDEEVLAELETADGAEASDPAAPPLQETVPFKRYDYERGRRKQAEQERDAIRVSYEQRLSDIIASLGGPKQEPAQPAAQPAPEIAGDDYISKIDHVYESLQQQQKERQETERRTKEENEQRTYVNSIMGAAQAEYQAETKADAQFEPLYNTLLSSFQAELGAMIPANAPNRDAVIHNEMMKLQFQHANYARSNNLAFPDYIRAVAKARGLNAPQAQPQQNNNPVVNAGEKQKIMAAAASLSGGGGSPASTGMPSPQQLLEMTPKQFDEWRAKHELRGAFAA